VEVEKCKTKSSSDNCRRNIRAGIGRDEDKLASRVRAKKAKYAKKSLSSAPAKDDIPLRVEKLAGFDELFGGAYPLPG